MSNQIFYISGNKKFYINENSGVLVLNNLDLRTNSRPTINGTGVLLSGEGATLPSTIVYTTGSQTIGGIKTFSSAAGFISGLFGTEIIGLNVTAPNLIYNTGNQTISGVKTFANGSNQILNTTYSTLTGLKATSGLLSGQLYRISDFVLKWNNQSINDSTVKTAVSGEPLIVTALSNKQIYHIAQSETYPQDTIYYNIDASGSYSWGTINNTAAIPDFKGWIYRRVDNLINIDMPYDWRNITVNCCKPDVSSVPNYSGNYTYGRLNFVRATGSNYYFPSGKIFYSIVAENSGNALDNIDFWSPASAFTESGTYFATDESYGFKALYIGDEGDAIINLPALTGSRIQQPVFTSTLTGLGTFTLSGVDNIKVEGGHSNVMVGINNYQGNQARTSNNKIGNNFYFNTIDHNFFNNTIGNNFIGNILGYNFFNNIINDNFNYNNIGNSFSNNNIGSSFYFNTVGSQFYNNHIERWVTTNNFGYGFSYNYVKSFFGVNNIGIYASSNTIGMFFQENTIGASFVNNNLSDNFSSNTIGNNFRNNISEGLFSSINFLTSTHVYSGYNTTLFKNAALSQRLRYFNSSDQLVVTDPTA